MTAETHLSNEGIADNPTMSSKDNGRDKTWRHDESRLAFDTFVATLREHDDDVMWTGGDWHFIGSKRP